MYLGILIFCCALVFTWFPVYMQMFTVWWYEDLCWAWAGLGVFMFVVGVLMNKCGCCVTKYRKVGPEGVTYAREGAEDASCGGVRAPIPYVMIDP